VATIDRQQALANFAFENAVVRVLTDGRGEPWFVAADVCAALDIVNSRGALSRLDDDEKGVGSTDTLGGAQQLATVNESGLYSLVLGSRKAEAKRFKRWVTHEVLPTIRRTGSYGRPADPEQTLNNPVALRGLLLGYTEKVLALEQQVGVLAPKAEALDKIAKADGSMCVTDAAKTLQMRPKDLFAWLQAHQWIYRRPGGSGWIGYQSRIQVGYLEHKVATVERGDGTEKVVERVLVTAKGLAKLAEALGARSSALHSATGVA
jgi:anti-repressor protein